MRYAGKLAGAAAVIAVSTAPLAWAQSGDLSQSYERRLTELLRNQGYSRIEFVDREGTTLAVTACSENAAYRVTINRTGRVLERDRTGACPAEPARETVSEDVIVDSLYGRGYLRVNIVDRTPPTLLANACRGDRQFQVRLDNEGGILDVKDTGRCKLDSGDTLEPAQVERILTLQGYSNIRITEKDDAPYIATACNGIRQFELRVSESADVEQRKATGFCDARNVEYLPARPIEQARLEGTEPLDPQSCQMVLDWLQQEQPLTFRPESANLSDDDKQLIADIVATIKRCPATEVLIEGHTSRVGDDAFNQDLSERRSLAVHQALRDAGAAETRLKARGFGEAYPRVSGDDAALNRRIEINLEWDASRA
jgi:outer membrane protein OmpA-like peptidoglycan-associated protein